MKNPSDGPVFIVLVIACASVGAVATLFGY